MFRRGARRMAIWKPPPPNWIFGLRRGPGHVRGRPCSEIRTGLRNRARPFRSRRVSARALRRRRPLQGRASVSEGASRGGSRLGFVAGIGPWRGARVGLRPRWSSGRLSSRLNRTAGLSPPWASTWRVPRTQEQICGSSNRVNMQLEGRPPAFRARLFSYGCGRGGGRSAPM